MEREYSKKIDKTGNAGLRNAGLWNARSGNVGSVNTRSENARPGNGKQGCRGIRIAGIGESYRNLAGGAIQMLFPLRCPVCDDIVVPYGEKICLQCMKKLKYIGQPRCLKCGKGLEEGEKEYCLDCSRGRHLYVRGRALFQYDCIAPAIYRLKYRGRREYADFFGEEIARYLGDFIREVGPDGLIPVPLHRTRQKKRGYNQALLLAQAIGRYTGVPVYDDVVRRVKATTPLKQLNPQERQNNLKKAFHIVENDVKLRVIIIVDDIYTTGATIDAVSAVLKDAGAERVYFITLACGKGL